MFRGRLWETGQEIRISVGAALAVLECVAECGEKNRVIAGRARCGPPLCRCSRTPCDPKRHKTSCPKGRLEGFRWPRKCYQLPSRARRCLSESRVAWLIYSLTRTEPALLLFKRSIKTVEVGAAVHEEPTQPLAVATVAEPRRAGTKRGGPETNAQAGKARARPWLS